MFNRLPVNVKRKLDARMLLTLARLNFAFPQDGGDQTWRGTYRALLHKRQQRRSAVRQLLRIPFPLNPLAPWLPHTPGQARLPPHNDARFPLPWMVPVPMPWGSGTGSWGLGGNTLPIDNGPLSDGIRSYSVSRVSRGLWLVARELVLGVEGWSLGWWLESWGWGLRVGV